MGCFSTTVKTSIPKPTTTEKQQQALFAAMQEEDVRKMGFDVVYETTGKGKNATTKAVLTPRAKTPDELEEEQFNKDITKVLREQLLGQPSEETKKRVGEVYDAARISGEEDINRVMREIAGSRGMNTSDSPVAAEAGRAVSRLTTGLRSAEATSLLNVGQAQKEFALQLRDFQENLRQQSFLNRTALSGGAANYSLGLADIRTKQPTVTSNPSTMSNIGGILGIGSKLIGMGKSLSLIS